jgi:hypothetical protein
MEEEDAKEDGCNGGFESEDELEEKGDESKRGRMRWATLYFDARVFARAFGILHNMI